MQDLDEIVELDTSDVEEVLEEIPESGTAAAPPAPATSARRQAALARLQQLASIASQARVTERSATLLFRDWESARSTEEKAEKMLADARAWKVKAAEAIVSHMGLGQFRYKDTLYSPAINGDTIFLRPLRKKKIPE